MGYMRRLDSLEAAQGAPRAPRRDSRGERSPWLPLETRPDSPGEPGMQPRDPCLPWRGIWGPGHTPRWGLFGRAVTRAQPPAFPRNPRGRLGFPGPTQGEGWDPRRNSRFPPQLEENHVVSTSLQDEPLARYGVSREVPVSVLKYETVPDTFHATPRSSPTHRVPLRETPRVPTPLHLSPFSPPDGDRSVDSPAWSGRDSRPSRRISGWGRPHKEIWDEPRGWCHMTIELDSRSTLEKNPLHGHLFEGNPVGESAIPQILPHKPGADSRLGRLFTPPSPQELVRSGLATLRPQALLGPPQGTPSMGSWGP